MMLRGLTPPAQRRVKIPQPTRPRFLPATSFPISSLQISPCWPNRRRAVRAIHPPSPLGGVPLGNGPGVRGLSVTAPPKPINSGWRASLSAKTSRSRRARSSRGIMRAIMTAASFKLLYRDGSLAWRGSSWRTRARGSWTRWATFRRSYTPSCSACSSGRSSSAWASWPDRRWRRAFVRWAINVKSL